MRRNERRAPGLASGCSGVVTFQWRSGSHRPKSRFTLLVCLLALLLGGIPWGPAWAEEETESFRRHIFVEVGPKYVEFDVDFDDRMTEFSSDFNFQEEGTGVQISIGYAPDADFRFQADLAAGEIETNPSDATGAFAQAGLGINVPLARLGPSELALFGGFGGSVLYFDHDRFKDRAYLGGFGETGFTLRLHLSKRVALQTRATYAVHSIAREALNTDEDDDNLRVVGGSAWYRVLGAGLVISF